MSDIEKAEPDVLTSDAHKSNALTTHALYGIAPAAPVTTSVGIASPTPLGLLSYASTNFLLSLYTVGVRGVHEPNVIVGMAVFVGGLAMILAGMWEFPCGNIFGATAFITFGAWNLSYAAILIPGFGVVAAYTSQTELANALGVYFMTSMMVSIIFLVVSTRTNIALFTLFVFDALTGLFLGAGEFTGSTALTNAGGAFGIITSLLAFYLGLALLLSAQPRALFKLPIGPL